MFSSICMRKQKLAVGIILLISITSLLWEKFKHKQVPLEKKITCQKVNQVLKTMSFLVSAGGQDPLFKNGKFSTDEVLRWQLMLIQECPWKPNATAVMQHRAELGQCCNASHRLVVTKENAPLGSTIHFDGVKVKIITVDSKLTNMLLERFPLADAQYSKCALIGNGGILQDSRFKNLEGPPMAFIDAVRAYPNALFLIPALSFHDHIELGYRALHILKDIGLPHQAFFLNPHYLRALDIYWKQKGMTEIRLSTGFMFTSFALEFCDHITLYGFWPFLFDLTGKPINHHYYDNVLPHPFVHSMSEEFSRYIDMYAQGVLRIQLGKCQ